MSRFGDLVSGKEAAAPAAPEPVVVPSEQDESSIQPPAEVKVIDLNKKRKSKKSK